MESPPDYVGFSSPDGTQSTNADSDPAKTDEDSTRICSVPSDTNLDALVKLLRVVQTEEALESAVFVIELLEHMKAKMQDIKEKAESQRMISRYAFNEKNEKGRRSKVWRAVALWVILGTKHIVSCLHVELEKWKMQGDTSEDFKAATECKRILFQYYLKWLEHEAIRQMMAVFRFESALEKVKKRQSPWMEVRTAVCHGTSNRIVETEEKRRPEVFFAKVERAQKEWLMIQGFADHHKKRGIMEVEAAVSSVQIEEQLGALKKNLERKPIAFPVHPKMKN